LHTQPGRVAQLGSNVGRRLGHTQLGRSEGVGRAKDRG